ncbi:MAG: geranylgeranylglycerol-phosphate geranylgeranyltransferase [Deltaproteobacteria bacterium]
MKKYLALIRLPNLAIIVLLQSMIYYGILLPVFRHNNIEPVLGRAYFVFFILITLFVTASGYIINDIMDIEPDKINKPSKRIVGKSIEINHAKRIYFVFLITGFVLSIWVAIAVSRLEYLIFYIIPVILLYFYSTKFKTSFLSGNLIVSFFSAGVTAIIFIFEFPGLVILRAVNPVSYTELVSLFVALIVFSFLVSLLREIVKDIEDIEGDQYAGSGTLPVKAGVNTAKAVCGFISIVILILLFYWIKSPVSSQNVKIYTILALILPLTYAVWLLKNAETKKQFHKLSTVIKLIMLLGIMMVVFYF